LLIIDLSLCAICNSKNQECWDNYPAQANCPSGGTTTVTCHKHGWCSGVGDGTKCSWGSGSYCDDPRCGGTGNMCPTGKSPRDSNGERSVPCTGPSGLGCCCNYFVQGMLGNTGLGRSGDMRNTLPRIGWCRCSGCKVGAVAANNGHTGFVNSCDGAKMSTLGANQSCEKYGGCFNQCGCDNISIWRGQNVGNYEYFHPSCC